MKPKAPNQDRDTLALTEESAALLRRAPASAWAAYLVGAAPYGLGLIWFWLENSRSAFAREHLGWSAGVLALLFLWKQVCEALFLAQLRALAGGKPSPALTLRRIVPLVFKQAALQPTSFLAIPLALLATVPLPYTLLFYRQFSLAAAAGNPSPLRHSFQTSLCGKGSLWTLTGIAALGALLLYVNLLAAAVFAAQMASSIFGVESLETSVLALLSNTTVHFTIGVLVYLALDVLFDGAAALQEFRAVSVRSGDDILSALRRSAAVAVSMLLAAFLLAGATVLHAQVPAPPGASRDLDHAIEQTLQHPEFAWRLAPASAETPPFLASLFSAIDTAAKKISEMVRAIAKWFEPKDSARSRGRGRGAPGSGVQNWMIVLAVLALVALVVVLALNRRRPPRRADPAPATAAGEVDLRDESLLASSLPEDEWLRLAERHLREGERRLALRALHLGCLRALSARGLITVKRSKTGMEYLDELRRRARQKPTLAATFAGNVRLFELAWYSSHPVNHGMVESYRQALEEIRTHAV